MGKSLLKVWRSGAVSGAGVLICLTSASVAHAYTIENAQASGCHERITSEALRAVRLELANASPLPRSADEIALVRDLQFIPAKDMADLGGATLLISVRDNDLKGRGSSDLTALPAIHGNPDLQDEHCLRGIADDEPGGSSSAVQACRTYIRNEIAAALEGLDDSGAPTLTQRTQVPIHLSIRGDISAPLPTYYVRVGHGLHALQDSFTHTYRTADSTHVTVTLNWVDYAENQGFDEAADGPAHSPALDACDDSSELLRARRVLATEASTAILRATLDPAKSAAQKMAAVDAVLDASLGFTPGCDAANQWCNAPEALLPAPAGCGCNEAGALLPSVALLLGLLTLGRRVGRRLAMTLAMPVLVAAALLYAHPSFAQTNASVDAVPPPPVAPVAEPGPANPSRAAFGGSLAVAGSFDRAAAAVAVGLRLRASKHWSFGLDAEWNPWFGLNGASVRTGVVNAYLSVMLRVPLTYQAFNLRTTLSLGGSYLLSDFYGAPSGSIGLFAALAPLGLEWKASKYFYIIVNPASIAVPVPHITGLPFWYPQYRATVAIEFYAG